MACKVNWTSRAWLTFESNIAYLQKEWTAKEISNFVGSIDKKIAILSQIHFIFLWLVLIDQGHPFMDNGKAYMGIFFIAGFQPTGNW